MKKWLVIFSVLVVVILIIAGGAYIMKEKDNKRVEEANEKEALIAVEKPRIEKYFKHNFTGIDQVTVEDVDVNPTGIPHITGYVNNNKDLFFDAAIHKDHFEGDLIIPFELGEKQKSDLSVSEIEALEK